MREASSNLLSTKKLTKWIRDTATIFAIGLALSSCSTPQEKYEEQLQKVQELEHSLKQQAENYHRVAVQENIQQDLKDEWADATINQEIWYSLDRANDQDKNIAKTKEKLSKAQRELARMQEEMQNIEQINEERLNQRLKTDKYDYIPEEFKRSRGAK